jgi:GMP synthase-like glutamine amidotransferase
MVGTAQERLCPPYETLFMPKITIIETGVISPANRARHGSFPQMFERLLGEADASASFATIRLMEGEALPDPAALQAILLTGSPAGVYDDLDWIAPLERFVRAAYDSRIPMAGICFGHQLIAQALGGTVRKSEKGWGLGRHVYDVVPGNGVIDGKEIAIAASHQDQVIEPPAGATTIFHSAFTPYAGLLYANGTTFSVQPHPEFTTAFAHACCEKAGQDSAPEPLVATAKASLEQPLDNANLGRAIARFLAGPRTA